MIFVGDNTNKGEDKGLIDPVIFVGDNINKGEIKILFLSKYSPNVTVKSASAGSATTPEVQAQPFKEAGAAESFLCLLSFDGKKKVTLSAAIPAKSSPCTVCLRSYFIPRSNGKP